MEVYQLEKDIKVFYVRAASFPEGVKEAWVKLHKLIGVTNDRDFYGISHGNHEGGITYSAAVKESFSNEGEHYGCEKFNIPRGEYLSITIHDYMNHLPLIGQAFRRLLSHPEFDGVTPCIEWYKSDKEVVCMVKRKEN